MNDYIREQKQKERFETKLKTGIELKYQSFWKLN